MALEPSMNMNLRVKLRSQFIIQLGMPKQGEICKFMASVEQQTKQLLASIREIDRNLVASQAHYHNLASAIIHSRNHTLCNSTQSNSSQSDTPFFLPLPTDHSKELEQLGRKIKEKLKAKVAISELLYNKLADACEQFEDFMEADLSCTECSDGNTFLLECLGNQETSGIILQCQARELEGMCVCKGRETSTQMIKCQSLQCKGRWFHLKCIGLRPNCIPEGSWKCTACKKRDRGSRGNEHD